MKYNRKYECCRFESNMGPEERLEDSPPGEIFRRCRICGRRHFEVTLDPGEFQLIAKPL